jgi:hypothetical protein
MVASLHPNCAGIDAEFIIEQQRLDGRPPNAGFRQDLGAICTPGKVLRPTVLAGLKERDNSLRLWIHRLRQYTFSLIAESAGKPQIVILVCAAFCTRNDMLNRERDATYLFLGLAIAATMLRLFSNPLALCFGDHGYCMKIVGGWYPRRLSSSAA